MMALICTGDWHIRYKPPRNRKDLYYQAQFDKLDQIFSKAASYGDSVVLQPGDFFDTLVPYQVVSDMIDYLLDWGVPVITIFGQHDTQYRRRENSPLQVLASAGVVHIAGETPVKMGDVAVWGASYGEEIPKPKGAGVVDRFKVLLIHRMVTEGGPLYPGQTDYISAEALLRQAVDMGYDLVVSGDNHLTFCATYQDKWLLNPGSLTRMRIDQWNHEPCYWMVFPKTGKVEMSRLRVKPPEEVFRKDADEGKEAKKKLEIFLDKVKAGVRRDLGLDFKEQLLQAAEKHPGLREFFEEEVFGGES